MFHDEYMKRVVESVVKVDEKKKPKARPKKAGTWECPRCDWEGSEDELDDEDDFICPDCGEDLDFVGMGSTNEQDDADGSVDEKNPRIPDDLPDNYDVKETVDGRWMILIDGHQWGETRDRAGTGDATFDTEAEARDTARRISVNPLYPPDNKSSTEDSEMQMYSTEPSGAMGESLSVAEMRKVCPSCARDMTEKGITAVSLDHLIDSGVLEMVDESDPAGVLIEKASGWSGRLKQHKN